MPLRIGIYCRSTSIETVKDGLSKKIREQRERLIAKVADMNRASPGAYEVAATYCDDGFSGMNTERPSLSMLREDIKAGKVNAVLVSDLSQLSRSAALSMDLAEEFSKYSVQLMAAKGVA